MYYKISKSILILFSEYFQQHIIPALAYLVCCAPFTDMV